MDTDNHDECCIEKKPVTAALDITLMRLQGSCAMLLNNVDLAGGRTAELANIQQWLALIPSNERPPIIEAWNAWIKAAAQYEYVQFESRASRQISDISGRVQILVASIVIWSLALWSDISRPHAFSHAVLMSLGIAAVALAGFGANSSGQSREAIVRAKLKARAVARHTAGWQLNSTGDAFLGSYNRGSMTRSACGVTPQDSGSNFHDKCKRASPSSSHLLSDCGNSR